MWVGLLLCVGFKEAASHVPTKEDFLSLVCGKYGSLTSNEKGGFSCSLLPADRFTKDRSPPVQSCCAGGKARVGTSQRLTLKSRSPRCFVKHTAVEYFV